MIETQVVRREIQESSFLKQGKDVHLSPCPLFPPISTLECRFDAIASAAILDQPEDKRHKPKTVKKKNKADQNMGNTGRPTH